MTAAVQEIDTARPGRVRALDGLRGAAALLIVLDHAQHDVFPSAMLGVDVFFVLSGFLITGILLAERERRGSVSLRHFYLRRALRLYPALLLTVAISNFAFHEPLSQYAWTALRAITYTTNLYLSGGGHAGALDQTWSLGVEEQFYLLWPLFLIFALRRRRPARVVLLAFVGFLAVHAVTVVTLPWVAAYMLPSSRFDQLIAGSLLAFAVRSERGRLAMRKASPPVLAWAAVAWLLLLAVLPDRHGTYEFARMCIVTAGTLVLISHLVTRSASPMGRLAGSPPAVWVGQRSYGLYLLHVLVIMELSIHTNLRPAIELPLVVVASLAAAALSYRFVEQPFLRLKERVGTGSRTYEAQSVVVPSP